ncbi:MAG: phosphotransferase family protein [Gammaproteobacteria bacterium]|jgi:thiamine kinase-like enzyme|nr:phosphotransferase family protein [Gammaproteobacteria bacterium]MDH3749209.1 phosphotransferase family protein [Gammaproteobacteria bacterium]MDH3804361.1 phosphotransferase family protein [Gammaproteobacteria bacterium]
MSVRNTPESVLMTIPGWEQATCEQLTGGLTNQTYLVDRGDIRAVLKIDDGPRSAPYNRRDQEAQVQTTAARSGLASPVLVVRDNIYMTEYLDGKVWTDDSLLDNSNLVQLARALRKLHALPLTGRSFDARAAARSYAARIDSVDANLTRDCLQLIESMPRLQNVCCCHNDLVVGNIIATPDVRFLDWEYACDNDPFFDLATVVAHHRMSPERTTFLLDAYFDGDGRRWQEHLNTMVRFYNALLWLWLKSRS